MKLGIVLNSNDLETGWNALRLGVKALEEGHEVKVFLLGPGVEIQGAESPNFDISGTLEKLIDNGGRLLACGTCVEARQLETGFCPISTMSELVEIISDSDSIVTFG